MHVCITNYTSCLFFNIIHDIKEIYVEKFNKLCLKLTWREYIFEAIDVKTK